VVSVTPAGSGATLQVETPDGAYASTADWLIAADGARSPIRRMLNLDSRRQGLHGPLPHRRRGDEGGFSRRALVLVRSALPPNQSVLLHRRPTTSSASTSSSAGRPTPEEEKKPENVIPRIKAMLGADREFDLEWVSVYTFQCRRMQQLPPRPRALRRRRRAPGVALRRARRQLGHPGCRQPGLEAQAGDRWQGARSAARQLQRGARLRRRREPDELDALDRLHHAQEPRQRTFRNAVLGLAKDHAFGRAWSTRAACRCRPSSSIRSLNTPDSDAFAGAWCRARRWTMRR
jgi:3-(3-hydroxy-phenyl)propionate hydroxylase